MIGSGDHTVRKTVVSPAETGSGGRRIKFGGMMRSSVLDTFTLKRMKFHFISGDPDSLWVNRGVVRLAKFHFFGPCNWAREIALPNSFF